jgi:oligo-1,6-glucosidase
VPRDENCFVDPKPEFTLAELKSIFGKWNKAIADNGWNTIYFGNHDNPRMLSRFGNTDTYWRESAKMLATILLTLRGTPYLYQGDEIGMSNCDFQSIKEYNDVQVINAYKTLVETGDYAEKRFLESSNKIARDHARTPMQWDDSENAGFTEGNESWLKVNPNYITVNAALQENDATSILTYYRSLINIRKKSEALIYGDYIDLRPDCNRIWLYLRTLENESYLVMNNFTAAKQAVELAYQIGHKILIISNYDVENDQSNEIFDLNPYESRIYKIN